MSCSNIKLFHKPLLKHKFNLKNYQIYKYGLRFLIYFFNHKNIKIKKRKFYKFKIYNIFKILIIYYILLIKILFFFNNDIL